MTELLGAGVSEPSRKSMGGGKGSILAVEAGFRRRRTRVSAVGM